MFFRIWILIFDIVLGSCEFFYEDDLIREYIIVIEIMNFKDCF